MKTYKVYLTTKVDKWVNIEAETAEDAVLIAKRKFAKVEVEIELKPEWVDDAEHSEKNGELSIEVDHYCDRCGHPILRRHSRIDGSCDSHDQPFLCGTPSQEQVGPGLRPEYFTWCYHCLRHPLKQLADQAE